MSKSTSTATATSGSSPRDGEPLKATSPRSLPLEDTDPVALNAQRSEAAIWKSQEADRIQETPPLDLLARALQPREVHAARDAAEAFLEPGPLVQSGGEAVPQLGPAEPYDAARHSSVDALERPTTVGVRASEQRLRMLHKVAALQAGVDAARTAKTRNSMETMLAHHLAVSHRAAMHLFTFIPGLDGQDHGRSLPVAEVARLANAAARLMDTYANGCLALQKLQCGGTQRVLVQHQQLTVTQNGPAVIVNRPSRTPRRGSRMTRGRRPKNVR